MRCRGWISKSSNPGAFDQPHGLGVYAQIAVKVYGDDLGTLQRVAGQIQGAMLDVAGLTPPIVEPIRETEELHIELRPDDLAYFGITRAYVANVLQTALQGEVVSQILEGQRRFDLLVRLEENFRTDYANLGRLRIDLPRGNTNHMSEVKSNCAKLPRLPKALVLIHSIARTADGALSFAAIPKDVIWPALSTRSRPALPAKSPRPPATSSNTGDNSKANSVQTLDRHPRWRLRRRHAVGFDVTVPFGKDRIADFERPPHRLFRRRGGPASHTTRPNGCQLGRIHFARRHRRSKRYPLGNALFPFDAVRRRDLLARDGAAWKLERLAPVLMTALTAGIGLIPLVIGGHGTGARNPLSSCDGNLGRLGHVHLLRVSYPPGLSGPSAAHDAARIAMQQNQTATDAI